MAESITFSVSEVDMIIAVVYLLFAAGAVWGLWLYARELPENAVFTLPTFVAEGEQWPADKVEPGTFSFQQTFNEFGARVRESGLVPVIRFGFVPFQEKRLRAFVEAWLPRPDQLGTFFHARETFFPKEWSVCGVETGRVELSGNQLTLVPKSTHGGMVMMIFSGILTLALSAFLWVRWWIVTNRSSKRLPVNLAGRFLFFKPFLLRS